MPRADRADRNHGAGPDRHARPVQPDPQQPADVDGIRRCAGPPPRRTILSTIRRVRDNDTDRPAPPRIGQTPRYGLPVASGASTSGYDSLNRKRQKQKFYPGQARPKPPPGPGSPPPLMSNAPLRLSIPPSETANKAPIPPSMAGTVAGQPRRKRLKIDDDPFGAVGDYAGSFLIKSAVELSAGYDTNPRRVPCSKGSPFYVIAPEFLAVSDWERHAVVADLRGSFTGYGNTSRRRPMARFHRRRSMIDRPDFTGHVDGRLDVSRDTRLLAQARLRVPPTIPAARTSRPACKISGLRHVRRHLRLRPEFQPPAGFRRRHRRPHRLSPIQNSPTALRPATTTATSTSSAASAASATI